MTEQQNSSNCKRRRVSDDSDDEPEVKHQKQQDGDDEELDSITNICFELLDRIFDSLDLKSLLNVAQTFKRLQIAAAAKFETKYGKRRIDLKLGTNSNKNVAFDLYGRVIEIFDTKFCLKFLRLFGSKVSNLRIARWNIDARDKTVVKQNINQYCSNTLSRILFFTNYEFSNEHFIHPFRKVEQVGIRYIDLRNNLPNFVKWFPNVRHLNLENFGLNSDCSSISFPHLEHLSIGFFNKYNRDNCLMNLLNANRQLKSLNLSFGSDDKLTLSQVLDMLSEHTLISKLYIATSNFLCAMNADANELLRLVSEHPQMVELDLYGYTLIADDAIILIEQLPSLKSFRFRIKSHSEYDRLQNRLSSKWQHNLLFENIAVSNLISITPKSECTVFQ